MKRLETVYWKRGKRLFKARFLSEYQYPAVRVLINQTEVLIPKSEVITERECNELRFNRIKTKAQEQLQPVIDAWNEGLRSLSEIRAKTHLFHLAIYQKIKAAKRWKFIS